MVVAMVNSPMQTSHSAGCKTQDSAEQDTINDVSLNSPIPIFFIENKNMYKNCSTVMGENPT